MEEVLVGVGRSTLLFRVVLVMPSASAFSICILGMSLPVSISLFLAVFTYIICLYFYLFASLLNVHPFLFL